MTKASQFMIGPYHTLRYFQDRSLGSVELRVSDLARDSTDRLYPFESTGKKTGAEPIRLDKGGAYKGQLYYTAEFVPALALEGVKFDAPANEIQRATEVQEDPDGQDVRHSSSSSSSSADDNIAPTPTITEPKDSKAPGSPVTPKTANSTAPEVKDQPEEPAGVKMGLDELLTHRAYSACRFWSLSLMSYC